MRPLSARAGYDTATFCRARLGNSARLGSMADQHDAVASAAAALSRFHAEAADICSRYA